MKLVDILNNVLEQSGFLSRDSYAASTDPDDKQMVAIANRVAYEIMNFYKWGELRNTAGIEWEFNKTVYDLPVDFQDYVPNSMWEQDGSKPVEFPVPDRRWYMYKFSTWSNGGLIRMKKLGNKVEISEPENSANSDRVVFQYISKWCILAEDSSRKEFFTLDTDSFLLDDQLLILGIQAHWMQTKLMPQYQEHMMNYRAKMNEAIGRSAGARTIGGSNGIGKPYNGSPYYPLYR